MSTTHFGFKTVPEDEKATLVRGVFDRVASRYDVMNDLMSAGLHRVWKNEMVAWLAPRAGMKILDVAGGTGDIAFRILNALSLRERARVRAFEQEPPSPGASAFAKASADTSRHPLPEEEGIKIVVCDINQQMLDEGRNRAIDRNILSSPSPLVGEGRGEGVSFKKNLSLRDPLPLTPSLKGRGNKGTIEWLCANAESLPLPDAAFDAYTIAFGIRNVTHIDKALAEACRVLKPGGRFLCLEFSHLAHESLQKIYDAYSFHVIPKIGEWVTGSGEPYKYLVESIRQFPDQEKFSAMIRAAGLDNVQYRNLTLGTVAIHSARKL